MALQNTVQLKPFAVGFAVVIISFGTWLPWIRINPSRSGEPIPDILLPHMYSGFEWGSGLILLPLVVLLLVAALVRPLHQSLLILCAGMWAVAIPLQYLRELSLVGFSAIFVPWVGWYLTLGGGLLLTAIGSGAVLRRVRSPQS